jgi:hypothetical protein
MRSRKGAKKQSGKEAKPQRRKGAKKHSFKEAKWQRSEASKMGWTDLE